MSISNITAESLRNMNNREGLILRGCGGEISEWVDGINDDLTKKGILLDGTKFTDVFVFKHKDLTCILFPFDENIKLSVGRLPIWRLATHEMFAGIWLSDFVNNELGDFVSDNSETPISTESQGMNL